MSTISLPEAVAKLKALQMEIERRGSFGMISEDEWKEIKRLARAHELPCVLHHAAYGFCLAVYEPGDVRGINPDHLVVINDHQFPFSSAARGFAGQGETLRRLRSLTHRERNHELLAWCGFKPLKPIQSYVY